MAHYDQEGVEWCQASSNLTSFLQAERCLMQFGRPRMHVRAPRHWACGGVGRLEGGLGSCGQLPRPEWMDTHPTGVRLKNTGNLFLRSFDR